MNTNILRASRAPRILRMAAPLALGAICLAALGQRLDGLDAGSVREAVTAIGPLQWLAAILATALSFWSLGRYDAVIHRHLGTGVTTAAALRSGPAAIALSQVLGLGVLTGALARWRMLPGLPMTQAAKVSALVAVSFMVAWAALAAMATLLVPLPGVPRLVGLPVLLGVGALPVLALLLPRPTVFGRRIVLPTVPAMLAVLGFAALDTFAAALALHVLLPPEVAPGFATVFAAYLLALGAALATGTPGGVGPFELALVALLPAVPDAALMGTVIAFRLVYYALPACIALGTLARPIRNGVRTGSPSRLKPWLPRDLAQASRAELGVARQNGAKGLDARGAGGAVVETPQTLTLLFATVRGCLQEVLPLLRAEAEKTSRVPCFYKISARDAITARSAGWHVVRVADEAVVTPAAFDLASPAHRQLRRKLRHAAKAQVTVTRVSGAPPTALSRIDAAWTRAHGGARGVTMGRHDPDYVAGQRLYLASIGDQPVAFVTFHAGPVEWTLDLMRHLPDLPDGTMHSLIAAAIEDARDSGLPRLSLAAIPASPQGEGALTARVRAAAARRGGGVGLTRFKTAFAPRLEPLYAAAPDRAALALALLDLTLAIRRPPSAPETAPGSAPGAGRAIAFARQT